MGSVASLFATLSLRSEEFIKGLDYTEKEARKRTRQIARSFDESARSLRNWTVGMTAFGLAASYAFIKVGKHMFDLKKAGSADLAKEWDSFGKSISNIGEKFRKAVLDAGVLDAIKKKFDEILNTIKLFDDEGKLSAWAKDVAYTITTVLLPAIENVSKAMIWITTNTAKGWLSIFGKTREQEIEKVMTQIKFFSQTPSTRAAFATEIAELNKRLAEINPMTEKKLAAVSIGGPKRELKRLASGEDYQEWKRAIERANKPVPAGWAETGMTGGGGMQPLSEEFGKMYMENAAFLKEYDKQKALESWADTLKSESTKWKGILENFGRDASDILGDTFFDVMQGRIESLSDYWSAFTDAIQRSVARGLATSIIGGGGEGGSGILGKIFHSAQGGIFTRPSLTTIAERGPEAVIPLSGGGIPMGGGGTTVHNNFQGAVFMDQNTLIATLRNVVLATINDDYASNGIMRSMIRS